MTPNRVSLDDDLDRPRKPESAWWIDEDWAPIDTADGLDPIRAFVSLLRGPTGDGQAKRDAGLKVHWTIDQSHYPAALRHWHRYEGGERYDDESNAHALVHCAWRLLATAWQEMKHDGRLP